MGFDNISEYASAANAGRTWFTQFRKAANSTITVTSNYVDYTYYSGSPLANFYASTPLESAYVDASRGIYVPSVSPAKQFLKNITALTVASSSTNTTNQRQEIQLLDYLMYYPFIDTDSLDQQDMVQVETLPRYASGQVLAISQSASASIGQFTFTYTNQDGVAGRVSPNSFTQIVAGGGQSLVANISGGGFNPYLPLQAGDSGVKSIESVTFTALGGGLMALVIVQPIRSFLLASECRRQTTGGIDASFGAASSVESLINQPFSPQIIDGAVLGILAKANGGSLASSILSGYIETIWSE